MKVFKVFIDFDKEERYLNEMAHKGYALVKYSSFGVYTFKKIAPQSLRYKVDYRIFKKESHFQEYVTLFEDAGWEHVYGNRYSGSQYFLPKANAAQEEPIFSDTESLAGRSKRQYMQCLASFMILTAFCAAVKPPLDASVFDFRSWYYTPGLWDSTGAAFWRAFLFETPVAILRIVPIGLFSVLTVIYGVWSYRAYRLYKRFKLESVLKE